MMIQTTSQPIDIAKYMTVEALEDGLTVSFSATSEYSTGKLHYCIDGSGEWHLLPDGVETPEINSGQTISFRAKGIWATSSGMGRFVISKKCNLKGNVMSLDLKNTFSEEPPTDVATYRTYRGLFSGCTTIINIDKDFLQATEEVESYAYYEMFAGCTNLVTAPDIKASKIGENSCTSMFSGCTSLTTAPELPATTLATSCYSSMFYGCTSLTYIKMMATDISASGCLSLWVSGVASSGTFVKNSAATWDVIGISGVPSGWTVETADA